MQQKNYTLIGVMSGTSLDGIDLAYVKINQGETISATILIAETVPYVAQWKLALQNAHTLSLDILEQLDMDYTQYLAKVIHSFIKKYELQDIDAVCSHGHTVLHQPHAGYTLQIGNRPELLQLLGVTVVCDFRVQDVALGGQGAPLVPIGDQLLFNEYDYCLNLGGFANVSLDQDGKRIAYDICAVNTVLNAYAEQLGVAYDAEGAFAKAGNLHSELLEQLNALPFYQEVAPKSLGIEWVHGTILPLIESFKLDAKDVLATFTAHVAMQLKTHFKAKSKVLVTGGGAYNAFLLELLQNDTTVDYILPDPILIEYKEALIFALLGMLKLENKINTLASVTGAHTDHSSGKIYLS